MLDGFGPAPHVRHPKAKVREECADRKAKEVADMAKQLPQYATGLSEGCEVLAGIDILCSTRKLNNSYRLYRMIT